MPEEKSAVVKTVRMKDYERPRYKVGSLHLTFDLDESDTLVTADSDIELFDGVSELRLDGDELELKKLAVDGRVLNEGEYALDATGLTLVDMPRSFKLHVETLIHPDKNTKLQGLYVSNGSFITQCEPEGFRRMTFFPDHPDVMTSFSTTIRADDKKYPVLLSNGNPGKREILPDGRACVTWTDPFLKPSYLFALVAGDLAHIEDFFTTRSGRRVKLGIYAEHGFEDQLFYAMDSLKRAMKWDEDVFGREYDLDLFNIVAVSYYNMGAMENKGLNVFNISCVLAGAQTSTDTDFATVESVIAHEYFHNWTGDRITVANWFNLSLKEGLTVYRDQEFSRDQRSRAVNRINDVYILREHQFPEDAGPLAHSVRPEEYVEIDNFYTSTVYDKGAEVIRMYEKILGREKFLKAHDIYFDRFDGQAVTIDDYADCMAEAGNVDVTQFKRWYSQAGTPTVFADGVYDAEGKTYTLSLRQETKPTPKQPVKKPFVIPLEIGFLTKDGTAIPLRLKGEDKAAGTSRVLILTEEKADFVFLNVPSRPVLSANRDFTAPIYLKTPYGDDDLTVLMKYDVDLFNKWDAGQEYAVKVLLNMARQIQNGEKPVVDEAFLTAFGEILKPENLTDKAFGAKMATLPSELYLLDKSETPDPDAIRQARQTLLKAFAEKYADRLKQIYDSENVEKPYAPDEKGAGGRALKNMALIALSELDGPETERRILAQYEKAGNMTDRMAAFSLIVDGKTTRTREIVSDFYERFKQYPLVVNKWFAAQAGAHTRDAAENVRRLTKHPAFDQTNPNRVKALTRTFAANPAAFHAADGSGYALIGEMVERLDPINPVVAADAVKPLTRFKKYDEKRQALMKAVLKKILTKPHLSKNVYELVYKSLNDDS